MPAVRQAPVILSMKFPMYYVGKKEIIFFDIVAVKIKEYRLKPSLHTPKMTESWRVRDNIIATATIFRQWMVKKCNRL